MLQVWRAVGSTAWPPRPQYRRRRTRGLWERIPVTDTSDEFGGFRLLVSVASPTRSEDDLSTKHHQIRCIEHPGIGSGIGRVDN